MTKDGQKSTSRCPNPDIAEVFSRPRVSVQAEKFGLKAGIAMDLRTGWDFMKNGDRKRAMQWIRQNKPLVVVLSPPCTEFSQIQNLNDWTPRRAERYNKAVQMLRFAMEVAKEQADNERYFIFENPARATSWGINKVMKIAERPDVGLAAMLLS